ncbi:MAG: hypothetical protein M1840_000423 [Geoglossum simile]|nr:MAG: hypothetical protein M1840_000423 [Geoglossum simile]
MGVFSAAARSPRIASLEASKQIQKGSVKRRYRGSRLRSAKDEIGDTIIVATPNIHAKHINLQERGLSSLVTSVCVPLSPTSLSPSPKKRKAAAFDYDANPPARADRPVKRSCSIAHDEVSELDGAGNWTPPTTPQQVAIDLDKEVHPYQSPKTVDTSTAWAKPNVTWLDLVNESTRTNPPTTEQSPEPESPPIRRPPYRHLRQGGQDAQPMLPAKQCEESKERQAKGMVTARGRQQVNSFGGGRGSLVEVPPLLRYINSNTTACNTGDTSETILETSPPIPQPIVDSPALRTLPVGPRWGASLSPEVDVNASSLSLRKSDAGLEEPVANNSAVGEKLGQNHTPQHGVASPIVNEREALTSSPRVRRDGVCQGSNCWWKEIDGTGYSGEARFAISPLLEKEEAGNRGKIEGSPTDTSLAPETVTRGAREVKADAAQEPSPSANHSTPTTRYDQPDNNLKVSNSTPQSLPETNKHGIQTGTAPGIATKHDSPPPLPRPPTNNTMPPPPRPPFRTLKLHAALKTGRRHTKTPPTAVQRRARISIAELLNG